MFTTLPYLYRDASNYKAGSTIVLDGALTEADAAAIAATLDSGEFFIPFDLHLGIAELQSQLTSYPSEDDHAWHTLELDDQEVTETVPEGTATLPVALFVQSFKDVAARGGWDLRRAVDRLGV